MWRFNRRWFLFLALLAGSVVALRIAQHASGPPGPTLLEDNWDIPRLVAHLNARGLQVHVIPTQKDGPLFPSVFLTTRERDWSYFNRLTRDARQIEQWQGTVYCGLRGCEPDSADLDRLWGDCYFTAGPFLFFGDRALLEKVRATFDATSALPLPFPFSARLSSRDFQYVSGWHGPSQAGQAAGRRVAGLRRGRPCGGP
jgi:hypothetical protein